MMRKYFLTSHHFLLPKTSIKVQNMEIMMIKKKDRGGFYDYKDE